MPGHRQSSTSSSHPGPDALLRLGPYYCQGQPAVKAKKTSSKADTAPLLAGRRLGYLDFSQCALVLYVRNWSRIQLDRHQLVCRGIPEQPRVASHAPTQELDGLMCCLEAATPWSLSNSIQAHSRHRCSQAHHLGLQPFQSGPLQGPPKHCVLGPIPWPLWQNRSRSDK